MSFKIIKNGVCNLFIKRFAGPFRTRRKQLEKTQWMDREQLKLLQVKLLGHIVSHSYRTVPFYRDLMAQLGIKPDSIRTIEDIKRFPVLSKKQVREAGEAIISKKYPKSVLCAARTGGSTGTPMIIYRNWSAIGNEHAFVRRQWDWAGLTTSDRCAVLMSRVIAEPGRKNGRLYAYDPVMKELILSTYHLSKKTAARYVQAIRRFNVKAIVGYPSAVGFLAKICLDAGIKLNLKAALTTSEAITPLLKRTIAKAFGCKVFDFYGSAERICYIHTCEKGSYHIVPEYGLTELVELPGGGGRRCKVVATGFWNLAMPLIRYDTGDIVTKSNRPCPCGRQFDVVESIDGREGDVIITPSGSRLGVTLIIQLLYVICGAAHIAESQVIQDATDHLTIEYVPTEKFTIDNLERFRHRISRYLPADLRFDLKRVDSVKRTPNGKLRPLVRLID
jgi:phenylacetate-CoA ligase